MAQLKTLRPVHSRQTNARLLGLTWTIAVMAVTAAFAQTPGEVVLHSFAPDPPKGANPNAGLIRDAAGNLYGTAVQGGAWNQGVVYKVDPAGHQSVLYAFTGGADGGSPNAGVIRDTAGDLYGTTTYGGAAPGTTGSGVVYKLNTAGQETVLYSFMGGTDGKWPFAGVILDSEGNLYGTTNSGGTAGSPCNSGCGVVYKLNASGQETVLYSFTGTDGAGPYAGVIRDSAGTLYGTTFAGGTGAGVVYKIDTSGQETVLYSFTGATDGMWPYAGLILDSAGNLFGTTQRGGATGYGVVYELDTSGQKVLYSFKGGADGGSPNAGVIQDAAGNLYGTTTVGGIAGGPCDAGCGVVYKLLTNNREEVLYAFTGEADGGSPEAGVIRDSAGNLYGTATSGDLANVGVVYKIDAPGHETVLYSFPFGTDGANPQGGVIRDAASNFYGTTYYGGTNGAGTVYKLGPTGQETVLHDFSGLADGAYPQSSLILDSAGNLYGTARGGAARAGVVYKVETTGQETVLYTFTGGADGKNPLGSLIRDSAGSLYGTTYSGGAANGGVIFKLDTAGQETVLYNFSAGAAGHHPIAGLIQDSAGNFYGTTSEGGASNAGVVYKLDTTGHETVLYSFTGGDDGGLPYAGVVQDSSGNIFGTTVQGGSWGQGVVYRLDVSGHETVLDNFGGGASGSNPYAGVILDPGGNLLGTTRHGGAAGAGVIFKVSQAGVETVLYNFTGGPDGGCPAGGVIRDLVGNLYGTAFCGGNEGSGVVFKFTPQ
jgi:uncharacterized repeat protein (TIGR03803 family)